MIAQLRVLYLSALLAMPATSQKPGLDMLLMADIGHAREFKNLSKGSLGYVEAEEGDFSLYDGIADYIVNQGMRPKAALIVGDVGYGGGALEYCEAIRASFKKYANGVISEDMVFPAIGNHDVNIDGCYSPVSFHSQTCFYGDKNNLFLGSQSQMSFETWRGNWFAGFPGLQTNTILPQRATASECATTGGTASGAQCKFPFRYGPETFDGCTNKDHDQSWCYAADGRSWGNCASSCTPSISDWLAPTRYNLNLDSNSSVYIIVGLVAGTQKKIWNTDTPAASVPAGGASGSEAECLFLSDSLAHGRALGKTVFVYATHWFQQGCTDWTLIRQIDIWLYGHDHTMWQSPPKVEGNTVATVVQEQCHYPVRFLFGNGGFDSHETNVVSFIHVTEEISEDRTRVTFKVLDTCIDTKGNSVQECEDFEDGFNKRKAVPSTKNFGFMYDAPRAPKNRKPSNLDFVGNIQIDSKWVGLKPCSNKLFQSQDEKKKRCLVQTDQQSEAVKFRFYDVTSTTMRLAIDSPSLAPVVREESSGFLLQKYGFYDMQRGDWGESGVGLMYPQDGYLLSVAEVSEHSFTLKNAAWKDDLLLAVNGDSASSSMDIFEVKPETQSDASSEVLFP